MKKCHHLAFTCKKKIRFKPSNKRTFINTVMLITTYGTSTYLLSGPLADVREHMKFHEHLIAFLFVLLINAPLNYCLSKFLPVTEDTETVDIKENDTYETK